MIPFDKRLKEIEQKSQLYRNVREFYKNHPYLYKWSLKHNIELRKYFPNKKIQCKYEERNNKGVDCYMADTGKLYKHYAFVIDALRDLNLTYYYVHKVLNGELESVNGYFFIKCE